MKMTRLLMAISIAATISITSCSPKDTDIQAAIETKVKSDPDLSTVMVDVKDGVATLSGEVKSDAAKAKIADLTKDVKGLKSVTDNTTVTPPPPPVAVTAPMITADDPLTKSVMDATKDYPTVKASVKDGVIALTGTIAADKWKKLKMALDGLRPKKVDGSALTIK